MGIIEPYSERYYLGKRPGSWTPRQITWLGITYDLPESSAAAPVGIRLKYAFKENYNHGDLASVLKDVFARRFGPPFVDPTNPLDFKANFDGYVVIQLDPNRTWQFRIGMPAVTLKDDSSERYFDLAHYLSASVVYPASGPRVAGVRVAVFGVDTQDSGFNDGFNLHTQMMYRSESIFELIDVIFDPDIKNDGSPPPPPPDGELPIA